MMRLTYSVFSSGGARKTATSPRCGPPNRYAVFPWRVVGKKSTRGTVSTWKYAAPVDRQYLPGLEAGRHTDPVNAEILDDHTNAECGEPGGQECKSEIKAHHPPDAIPN